MTCFYCSSSNTEDETRLQFDCIDCGKRSYTCMRCNADTTERVANRKTGALIPTTCGQKCARALANKHTANQTKMKELVYSRDYNKTANYDF